MGRWDRSALQTDFWPCPPECADDALVTLSRIPHLEAWGYVVENARVWWTLKNDEGRDCAHLAVKRHVQRAISSHAPQEWP